MDLSKKSNVCLVFFFQQNNLENAKEIKITKTFLRACKAHPLSDIFLQPSCIFLLLAILINWCRKCSMF